MTEEFAYMLESTKPFQDVVDQLQEKIAEHKFRVLAVHDVTATLAEKGYERDPLMIIEACNAGFAHEALNANVNAALFMPCRYSVAATDGKTVVKLARPSMIAKTMPGAGLDDIAQDVENKLIKIMQETV